MNRPLVKFGLKPMTVGAMMGDQILMLPCYGIENTLNGPLHPNQGLFNPQNTTIILLICLLTSTDVEIQV